MLKRLPRLALHRYAPLEEYEPEEPALETLDLILVAANELFHSRRHDAVRHRFPGPDGGWS